MTREELKIFLKIHLIDVFTKTKPYPILEKLSEEQVNCIKDQFCELILKALENGIKYGRDEVCVSMYSLRLDFLNYQRCVFNNLTYPVVYELLDELGLPYEMQHSYSQKEDEMPSSILFSIKDLKRFSNVEALGALK